MTEEKNPLDEFDRNFRDLIGIEYDMNGEIFISEATRDSILNFAEAAGDNNPLWTNEEYAATSRFGGITAPPMFLYNITHTNGSSPSVMPPGLPPSREPALLYGGAELEFYKPVRRGDSFSVTGMPSGITRKQSKSLGPMLLATGEAHYRNQDGEPVGILRTTTCRFIAPERHTVHIERDSRPEVEARSPDRLAFERQRRGAEPRYWEDVQVGEEMTPVLEKGLLTMMEIIRFGLLVPSMARRIQQLRLFAEIGFSREQMQKRAGLEDASDYGPQRVCWLGQFVTDWMGDAGTLKKLTGQVRHPSIIGDVNTVRGRVKDKRIEDGEHLVTCEIAVENQAGLVTAPGTAVVALPKKASLRPYPSGV